MNKDWIKRFDEKFVQPIGEGKYSDVHFKPEVIVENIRAFIHSAREDAIDKTNKRWVERLAKFSRMGEISEKEVLQDFIKNKSDLLKG